MKLKWIIIFLQVLVSVIYLQPTNGQLTCVSKFEKNLVGVCMEIDSCVGAAITGNCSNSKHTCCVPESFIAPVEVGNNLISKELFLEISGNTVRNNAIYRYFAESLVLAEINTEYKIGINYKQS